LSLTTAIVAKELPTSIKLPSLEELELEGSGLEKAVLSWVGNHKDLKYLSLRGYDFSQSRLSWINNLTRLETLYIWTCSASVQQIPSFIGNLTKLT